MKAHIQLAKYISIYSILFALSSLFTSCEEVIEIDLNEADPVLVVEGTLYPDSVCMVRLSYTTSYFNADEPDYDNEATVTFKANSQSEVLQYIGNGWYRGADIIGKEGEKYSIEIFSRGEEYSSTSSIPQKTDITAIAIVEAQSFGREDKQKYALELDIKRSVDNDIRYMLQFITNGELNDSRYYTIPDYESNNDTLTFTQVRVNFDRGDSVIVRVYTMYEPVYTFYDELNENLINHPGQSATPFNPKSNISGGAMGVFATWVFDEQELVIRP